VRPVQIANGRGEHEHVARRLVIAQQELHSSFVPTIPVSA
jgi:hypothetical protein